MTKASATTFRRRAPDSCWWIDVIALNRERIRRPTGTKQKALAQEYHDRLKVELWHYCTYLRVLDAEASNATFEEIASVLFPSHPNDYPDRTGDQAVRDALKAAKNLRDRDYQALPLLQQKVRGGTK